MVGKKFLAIVVASSMISSGTISYAAEVANTGEPGPEMVENQGEGIIESDGEINEETGEDIVLSVSVDELFINLEEDAFFYINSNKPEDVNVEQEDKSIIEIAAVDVQEIEEAVKENAPEGAQWYKVTGLAVGETSIRVWDEVEEEVIAVTVNEENPDSPDEDIIDKEESESSTGEGSDDEIIEESPLDEETLGSSMEKIEAQSSANTLVVQSNLIGWQEEQDGIRYYFNAAGQYYTGIVEIEGILYYFDDTTGYLCQTAQWIEKEGKRYFCNEEGVLYRNQFIKFDTTYYYMGSDGSVQKGVFSDGSSLRYADETSGIVQMTSGWITCDGKKFFANEEGILYQGQFIKFGDIYYYMGADGSVQLGTFKVGNVWYHSDSSSGELRLEAGWIEDDGKKYYAGTDGTIYVSQFIKFGTTYYYMGADGSVQTGIIKAGGTVYYADSTSGVIQQEGGWIEYEGKKYYGKGDRTLYSSQFIKFGNIYYYMGADGSVQTGIIKVSGIVYYADTESGVIQQEGGWIEYEGKKYYGKGDRTLYSSQFIKFGNIYYYMGADGSVQTGIIKVNGIVYYADIKSGIIQQEGGWIEYEGKKYFGKGDRTLYSNQFIKFGTTYYYMGSDGSVQKGIVNANGTLYYANPEDGIIQRTAGWLEYEGERYFSKADGVLYSNQFIKFGTTYYYMGSDGSVQKGIVNANGTLYYANPEDGIIQRTAGWLEYEGKRYFSKADGVLYSNQFIKFGTTYYYMGSDGSVQKGIVNANGTLYYANPEDGIIQKTAGWIEYEGKKYFANETGVLYKNQFITFGADCYYMGSDGSVQKGRQYINGQWYYFDEETGLLERKPGWFTSGSNRYYQKSDGTLATGYTDIGGVRYYFNSSGALASRMGIDVSSWQGSINWSSVKAAGVEFVFIRAGYRGYSNGRLVKDTYFDQNVRGALAVGLDVGVYFFSQAITVAEAREEAAFVHNIIKNYDITYPVAFDAEYSGSSNRTGRADHLSPTTRTLMVNTFLSEIRNYGYTPMIYTGIYFMRDELQMSLLSNYQLWLARYNSTLGYDGAYKCWQYSSTGRVSGISGNVDMNVWLK